MASELYKIGRLVNDQKFITIVEAGMLRQAQGMTLGGTASTEKNLGIWVLKNPMSREASMIALVAADPTVLASVVMTNDSTNVDAVTDESVMAVISAKWSIVSTKYPTSAGPAA